MNTKPNRGACQIWRGYAQRRGLYSGNKLKTSLRTLGDPFGSSNRRSTRAGGVKESSKRTPPVTLVVSGLSKPLKMEITRIKCLGRRCHHQTGPAGKEVKRVYIEDGCDIDRELYLSLLVDRETSQATVVASTEGGMNIEEVAASTPEKYDGLIDPATGMLGYRRTRIAFGQILEAIGVKSAVKFLLSMYKAFEVDASMVEVNSGGYRRDVVALDAKMNFDDNALYRHKDVEEMRDEDDKIRELEAEQHDLNYIKLDGSISMVNGAWRRRPWTLSTIRGEPALLDVGGGATKERELRRSKLFSLTPMWRVFW